MRQWKLKHVQELVHFRDRVEKMSRPDGRWHPLCPALETTRAVRRPGVSAMSSPVLLALATAAALMLCACEAQVKIDLPADQTGNDITNALEQTISPTEARRDKDQAPVPGPAKESPTMPQRDPTATPSPAKPPAKPPRPQVERSPWQPPAEVDPVRPPPDDAVPL